MFCSEACLQRSTPHHDACCARLGAMIATLSPDQLLLREVNSHAVRLLCQAVALAGFALRPMLRRDGGSVIVVRYTGDAISVRDRDRLVRMLSNDILYRYATLAGHHRAWPVRSCESDVPRRIQGLHVELRQPDSAAALVRSDLSAPDEAIRRWLEQGRTHQLVLIASCIGGATARLATASVLATAVYAT